MKFGNIKLKENINHLDIANVVETAISFVFSVNENGTADYTPYFLEHGIRFGVIVNLIDGLTIEDGDATVDVVKTAMEDSDVRVTVNSYLEFNREKITEYVNDVVEFRKQEYLHRNAAVDTAMVKALQVEQAVNNAALEFTKQQQKLVNQQIRMNEQSEEVLAKMSPDEIAELNRKIASGELDMQSLADIAIKKYIETDKHDEGLREVIDEKNKKIISLEQKKEE